MVEIMRKRHCHLTFYPEIYGAFKLLCDASGYKKLNEVLEHLMLKYIDPSSLSSSLTPQPRGEV
jgi:hypothetical protein